MGEFNLPVNNEHSNNKNDRRCKLKNHQLQITDNSYGRNRNEVILKRKPMACFHQKYIVGMNVEQGIHIIGKGEITNGF